MADVQKKLIRELKGEEEVKEEGMFKPGAG